jgi:RNA exonuclease 1
MGFVDLKHIPCPAGERCTAFKCLFQHKGDRDESASTSSPQPTTMPIQNGRSPSADQDLPRKRLKVIPAEKESPSMAGTSSSITSTSASLAKTPSQTRDDSKPDTCLASTTRTISPPSLNRKPAPSGNSSQKLLTPQRQITPKTASPSSAVKASPSINTPDTPKQRKPEALNPRLLKSSPASYEIRFKLLKMLYQEFVRLNSEVKKSGGQDELKLVLSNQDLIYKALDDEEKTAIEKPTIYSNVIKNRIMQYKRMSVIQWKEERKSDRAKREARQKRAEEKALSGTPKKIQTGLTSSQEVQILRRLLTPIDGLSEHGYVPRVPADEDVQRAKEGNDAAQGWEKCDRCDKRFQVFPGRREEDGALASGGECTYHYGRAYYPEKQPGDKSKTEKRYRCCGQAVGDSIGCTTTKCHVFKAPSANRLAAVLNFAETPTNTLPPSDRAVGFDCEMCYTVYGLELVRLTAVAWPTGEELLDVLVQPLGEILDLNSRYSGVWPEDMVNAEPWTAQDSTPKSPKSPKQKHSDETPKRKLKIVSSPEVARDLLFSLLTPDTPLIGHGLENDLNSVRVVHPTIVDTILLYPHKHGLPYRYGLKHLMATLLSRQIQVETAGKIQGHDSAEDARAAGDLVRLKVSEEWKKMKTEGWTLINGEFVPPLGKQTNEEGKLTTEFLESQF